MLLSFVVIFNSSTPQTRKEDVVEDLQVQGQGLAITNFLFCMVWTFAYPAYIKFPGQEMPDFYPVFTLFNAWMGLVIFIFLGLSSKRFRFVLSRWKKRCLAKKKKKDVEASPVPVVPLDLPTEESVSESPSTSRPVSSRTTVTDAGDMSEETPVEDMLDEAPLEDMDDAPPAEDDPPLEDMDDTPAPAEDMDEAPAEDMDDAPADDDMMDDM